MEFTSEVPSGQPTSFHAPVAVSTSHSPRGALEEGQAGGLLSNAQEPVATATRRSVTCERRHCVKIIIIIIFFIFFFFIITPSHHHTITPP